VYLLPDRREGGCVYYLLDGAGPTLSLFNDGTCNNYH